MHTTYNTHAVKYAPLPTGAEGMTVVFSNATIQSEVYRQLLQCSDGNYTHMYVVDRAMYVMYVVCR